MESVMTRFVLIASLLAGIVVGCDEKPAGTTSATPSVKPATTETTALPANLRLLAAPANANEVAAVKATVKDGDRVVIRGVVAGRADPIAQNRAILTLLDSSIKTCDKNPADSCKTPWDACCEPADVLAKNSVTVQVVDAEGRPMKAPLSGIEGVKPLAQLIVTGIAKVSADGVVIVNVEGVHVAK